MYAVNDKVMYGQSGVCRITDICTKKFGKTAVEYYVLHPMYGEDTTIYCPVQNAVYLTAIYLGAPLPTRSSHLLRTAGQAFMSSHGVAPDRVYSGE